MELTKPQFIDIDAAAIVNDMIADYETATGKKLAPAQAERLLINGFAYREYLLRTAINEAALQNLVAFARFPALDYLGELVGVRRLPASKAGCLIRFTLVAGHGSLVIPSGIRVQSVDGQAIFITTETKAVAASVLTVDIKAECTAEGNIGNNYASGDIALILDPQPYITAAANLDTSDGGADEEGDEQLRERIKLAPAGFSNAGSKGAYKFFAKSAHPSIIDVAVTSPVPGQVNIYPLMMDGQPPATEIIDAVFAKCNADKVRPLTDTVVVQAPVMISYALEVNLTLLTDAMPTQVVGEVTRNLQAYVDGRKTRLGIDVVGAQIIRQSNVEKVYKAEVVSPVADIVVGEHEYTNCTGITVNVTGFNDE
ncbi:MAG: baseplate J/gp47 family protein [Flavipsychrobacter sp.]|nr:baseplate J/gp47 family protein [Flavipsychrobacter sp.]